MSPADSLPGLLALMPSVQSFGSHPPVRASQVPRPISRRALPPTTPAGPAAAPVLSTAGFRLQHSLAAWPPASLRFEAESGSLHIAAHAFASEGSDVRVAPHAAPSATCVHGQVTWLAPFIQLDWPGFAWRSRTAEHRMMNVEVAAPGLSTSFVILTSIFDILRFYGSLFVGAFGEMPGHR